jgi:solute carrier family 25 protein 39/40
MMAIPMVGIYLPLYDYLVDYIRQQDVPLVSSSSSSSNNNNNNNNNNSGSSIAAAAPLTAGVVARTAAVICTAPFELLRTRVQAGGIVHLSSSSSSSSNRLSHHLPLSGGSISRLWTGVGATLARDVPFSGLYWAMVEPIRSTLLPDYNNSSQQRSEIEIATANIVAGGLAGWIAGAVTTPLDVVKTRTQLLMGEKHPLIATLKEIGTTQGAGGLFQGWGARAARAAPACAIVLSAYEMLKHWH